jgi:hypothetical protein
MASRFRGCTEARHGQPRNVQELRSCFWKRCVDGGDEMDVGDKETAQGAYWLRILSTSPKDEMGATGFVGPAACGWN